MLSPEMLPPWGLTRKSLKDPASRSTYSSRSSARKVGHRLMPVTIANCFSVESVCAQVTHARLEKIHYCGSFRRQTRGRLPCHLSDKPVLRLGELDL
jgi:hypothetical protein